MKESPKYLLRVDAQHVSMELHKYDDLLTMLKLEGNVKLSTWKHHCQQASLPATQKVASAERTCDIPKLNQSIWMRTSVLFIWNKTFDNYSNNTIYRSCAIVGDKRPFHISRTITVITW